MRQTSRHTTCLGVTANVDKYNPEVLRITEDDSSLPASLVHRRLSPASVSTIDVVVLMFQDLLRLPNCTASLAQLTVSRTELRDKLVAVRSVS